MRVGRRHLGRPADQRGQIVEDPEAAAMRADDQVVVARVDHQIVVERGRQVGAEPRPVAAGVGRDEQRLLGPQKEQVRVAAVFAHDVDRALGWQPRRQSRPAAPEVFGAEEVRREVAIAVPVEGGVGDTRARGRCFDPADVGTRPHAAHVAPHLGPRAAAVAGKLHVAVVRAHPKHVRIEGRLGDGGDLAKG